MSPELAKPCVKVDWGHGTGYVCLIWDGVSDWVIIHCCYSTYTVIWWLYDMIHNTIKSVESRFHFSSPTVTVSVLTVWHRPDLGDRSTFVRVVVWTGGGGGGEGRGVANKCFVSRARQASQSQTHSHTQDRYDKQYSGIICIKIFN